MSRNQKLDLSQSEEEQSDARDQVAGNRGLWRDAGRRLFRNRLSLVGIFVLSILFVVAIFGPVVAPYPFMEQNLKLISQPPSADHWLGTDQLGRDVLSRILWGARTATTVAIFVTTISLGVGIVLGGVAAFAGGMADWLIMRLTDVVMSVPSIMLALLVNTAIKKPVAIWYEDLYEQTDWAFFRSTTFLDYLIVLGALAVVSFPGYARLIRGQILSLREREYVTAARSSGVPFARILFRHVVPNALGPVIVAATFGFSGAMVMEASLSYLGIGIQPPAASWGAMINDSLMDWRYEPWLLAMPAIALAISALGVNYLGDGLNDALNPRIAAGGPGAEGER